MTAKNAKKDSGFFQQNIVIGREVLIITANFQEGPYTVNMYLNNGETISGKRGTFKTLKGAEKAGRKWVAQHNA